jgi:hypothetical protein
MIVIEKIGEIEQSGCRANIFSHPYINMVLVIVGISDVEALYVEGHEFKPENAKISSVRPWQKLRSLPQPDDTNKSPSRGFIRDRLKTTCHIKSRCFVICANKQKEWLI